MYKKFVEPNDFVEEKEDADEVADKFGIEPPKVIPVDMNYGYVPVNLTQEDKSSNENLQDAHKANMARFGYEVWEE